MEHAGFSMAWWLRCSPMIDSGDVVAFDAGEADSVGWMMTVRVEVAVRPAVSGVGLICGCGRSGERHGYGRAAGGKAGAA
jgi:hypothetical protein